MAEKESDAGLWGEARENKGNLVVSVKHLGEIEKFWVDL